MRGINRLAVGLWKVVYKPLLRRAARQILKGRLFDERDPGSGRWLEPDVKAYLGETWIRVDALLPMAELDELPTFGNRHNVFLAVVTTAAYQALLDRGVKRDYAGILVADIGWKIYSLMLRMVSLPFRALVRDPGRRMERILRTLMIFPFSAPGRPGYEVNVWTEQGDTYTHWTHCPPHTFVRRLLEREGDRGELQAFRDSWCRYDWPGADLIASDGRRGHYSRVHTLSLGDSVCDMCWHGRVPGGTGARRSQTDVSGKTKE
ncbi:MAG: hypothetical protein P8126_07425 [Gammaproteobacteria bacterium]|jgi:hypothetical protein